MEAWKLNFFRSKCWKQDYLFYTMGIGEQGDKAINTNTKPGRGRHAMHQSFNKVVIHAVGILFSGLMRLFLLFKPRFLIKRVIQLGKRINQFYAAAQH